MPCVCPSHLHALSLLFISYTQLTGQPLALFNKGHFNRVPTIMVCKCMKKDSVHVATYGRVGGEFRLHSIGGA